MVSVGSKEDVLTWSTSRDSVSEVASLQLSLDTSDWELETGYTNGTSSQKASQSVWSGSITSSRLGHLSGLLDLDFGFDLGLDGTGWSSGHPDSFVCLGNHCAQVG